MNSLTGLSCTEANACVAAGGYGASFGDQTLVESWDGTTWSVVASPDQTTDDDVLNSVSCTSLSFCIAVGFYDNAAGIQRTLIESWRGKSWNIVSSPDTGSGTNVLTGVSCTSSSACTAVGYDYSSNTGATLVESWNGTTWKVVSSPNQGSDTSILDGVSCTSASACTAVGYYWSNGVEQTLVESWNGVAWVVAPLTPDPGSSDNSLTGVSCTSATRCTAVGEYLSSSYDPQTLIEVWNGVVWNTASSPDPGSTANQLDGVSCTSSSACTAVGYLTNGSGSSATQQTLVESWNGSAWKVATSPDQDSAANILSGVSCRSTQVCTAVGVYADGSGPEQTLIESWNGTSWAIVPSFDQGSGSNSLSAVSCTSTSACMAAGSFVDSSSTLTLVGALR